MKQTVLWAALILLGAQPATCAILLYDNTQTSTPDTILYSIGPYAVLGDQIELVSSGTATQAAVELFNAGGAGTFDLELDFYAIGSPVGAHLGSSTLSGVTSSGSDVLDLTFALGAGIALPQDVIFTLSVSNMSAGLDLGLDFFEPPAVGSSDNSFMIASTDGTTFYHLLTNSENVYFTLSGNGSSMVPEPSSATSALCGLVAIGTILWGRTRINR